MKGKLKMSKKGDLGKIALGAAIGVGAGVLLAPRSGEETRKILRDKMMDLISKVRRLDSREIAKDFENKVEKIERELANLDKEKVLKMAKKKASVVKAHADELVALAKEKGDEAIEKAADEVRRKAIEVTESVLIKLETAK